MLALYHPNGAAYGPTFPFLPPSLQGLYEFAEPPFWALERRAAAMAGAVSSSRKALLTLLNHPHPLDILGDPSSYGSSGNISRYHNPDSYTKALATCLRARRNMLSSAAEALSASNTAI